MKTKKQIEERLKILEDLIENKDFQEEIIMGQSQRTKLKMKIEILKWVLDISSPNLKNIKME